MSEPANNESTLKERLADEFHKFIAISLYLFVCFGVVSLYDTSQSAVEESALVLLGVAFVKALVMGKFVLIGELFKPGSRVRATTVLQRIIWQTLGLLIILVIFKILEELVVGLVHGQAVEAILSEFAERSVIGVIGPILMMLLILVPVMVAVHLDRALGTGSLSSLLLTRQD